MQNDECRMQNGEKSPTHIRFLILHSSFCILHFLMPTGLADGLGLESALGWVLIRPFAPPPRDLPRRLGPPHHAQRRDLGGHEGLA